MKILNYNLKLSKRSGKIFSASILLVLSVMIFSGCSSQPKSISVEVGSDAIKDIQASVSTTTSHVSSSVDIIDSTSTGSINIVEEDKPEIKPIESKVTTTIASPAELPVAFAQQAPFANWDALHEEACEEASMIMADKYFNKQSLDESIMETEIQKLVKWEADNNYQMDLTANEAADILKDHFNLSAKISTEVTADRIKFELSKGNLIIVPAAGRELGNPNFKQPGPIYHMLVIKGYNESEFITNDPGTRKGNGFVYKYDKLISAIHDWNHELAQEGMTDAEMSQGQKIMIIVSK